MNKIYAQGIFVKTVETKFGEMHKVSINCKKFVDFLRENVNEKGYVNLDMSKRKEIGQYGDSHYLTLDTWKPEPREDLGKPTGVVSGNQSIGKKVEESDVPF